VAVTRDRETTVMSQMNAYLLLLDARKLERSGDEVRVGLIAYFYARRK
jgi:hypothetical protein